MEFESNLLSSSKRTIGLDDDVAGDIHRSEILAGNLIRDDICDFIDDEEEMDYEYEEERVGLDEEDISPEDLSKVDDLICDQLGISNLLKISSNLYYLKSFSQVTFWSRLLHIRYRA
jgi:hypothetical protein